MKKLYCIYVRQQQCNEGRNNGVAGLIKKENPKVVDLGCICIAHLGNLCTVKAIKSLPFQVDDLLTDIYYHLKRGM